MQKGEDKFEDGVVEDGAVGVEVHEFQQVFVEGVVDDCLASKVNVLLSQFANDFQKLQFRSNAILRLEFSLFLFFCQEEVFEDEGKA